MKTITNGKIFVLCLGDFARGLMNGIITTYLLTFFIPTTSNTTLPQFFLNAALVMAVIRGIGTVVDAVTDPWVASLSDNNKSPLGRRIVFMRWAAVPYGLFCLLIYFPPASGASPVNAVWVGAMLILYYLFSTFYNIPYGALQAEVVTDPNKRVFLYTINSLMYVVSSALVFCTSMIKGMLMGGGVSELWALRIPFIVWCVMGAVAALLPSLLIREHDYVSPKPYHQSIWDALKATATYPNFAIITIGYLIMWVAFTFFNTAEVYYITNLLGLPDLWVTIVAVISIAFGVMTYPLVNILARRVGKKPLLLGACTVYVVLYTAIYNYQAVVGLIGGPAFAIIIGLVIAMPIAITNIIPASIFADLAQYDAIKTGQERAGMFFAARNFCNKLCQAIVAVSCSLLLGKGADGTGTATPEGIRNTALVAVISVGIALVVYIFYNDDEIVGAIKAHTERQKNG